MPDPYKQAALLGRGVNFGNLLDAPREGAWSIDGVVIEESHFDLAKEAGFESVRIPVCFSAHALESSPYTISRAFMERVDRVVNWGLGKGLRVVLDLHHYNELYKSPLKHHDRFIALWHQIAQWFKDYPEQLYYELLNEPQEQLTVEIWNELLKDCLDAVRAIDSFRTVVIDCAHWGNIVGLKGLKIPDEETNAIVSYHFYAPTLFTFQGQSWMPPDWRARGVVWPGPPPSPVQPPAGAEQWVVQWFDAYNNEKDPQKNPCSPRTVCEEIGFTLEWAKQNGRPLWMGEFTAQNGADEVSRANWLRCVRGELEKNGIGWSFWTLLSDAGSYLYDIKKRRWNTNLLSALGLA